MADSGTDFDGSKKVRDIEAEAALDPEHDWRVELDLPLRAVWQRHGANEWVLIKTGQGFA
jgi:hypothetical protein